MRSGNVCFSFQSRGCQRENRFGFCVMDVGNPISDHDLMELMFCVKTVQRIFFIFKNCVS
jgi:hypothetical protein